MIFEILGKFRIGIGNQKFSIGFFFVDEKSKQKIVENNFWSKNIFWVEKFLIEKKSWSKFLVEKNHRKNFDFSMIFFDQKIFDQFFFDQKFFDPKNIFRPKIIFDNFLFGFFVDEKSDQFFLITYSDAEFPQDSKNHT